MIKEKMGNFSISKEKKHFLCDQLTTENQTIWILKKSNFKDI
jgi:hypothetical protein